jgi:hypothetical protein
VPANALASEMRRLSRLELVSSLGWFFIFNISDGIIGTPGDVEYHTPQMDVVYGDVEPLTNSELSNEDVPGSSQACYPPARKRGISVAEIDRPIAASSRLLCF